MSVEAAPTILRIGDQEIDLTRPTLRAEEVAAVWDLNVWTVYEHQAELPVQPIRVGRCLRWPTKSVLATVALDASDGGEPDPKQAS
jgi:predicted DNA-binding transcriptional regulator AlpA